MKKRTRKKDYSKATAYIETFPTNALKEDAPNPGRLLVSLFLAIFRLIREYLDETSHGGAGGAEVKHHKPGGETVNEVV